MKIILLLIMLMFCAVLSGCQKIKPSIGSAQANLINYNIIQGSGSSKLHEALDSIQVQKGLLDVAQKPRTEEYLRMSLNGSSITPRSLVILGLLRRQGDLYMISFCFFNRADESRMRETTESHARTIADALLSRRTELEEIIKNYQLHGVDPRAALYIILGCFSLDWDGLALTEQKGCFSSPSFLGRLFSRTIVYGWQPPGLGRGCFYKGSHNTQYGKVTLTSFGDHEIQPRQTFPDFLWGQAQYPDALKVKLQELIGTSGEQTTGTKVASILTALRGGGMSVAALAKAGGIPEDEAKIFVDFLVQNLYLVGENGIYSLRIPVFTSRDSFIVQKIRNIGREEMERWLQSDYRRLHDELGKLAPFRYGVAQSDYFYYIWHDIFGAANRILVESGLYADPYSQFYGAKGVIPVAFESSLYQKP